MPSDQGSPSKGSILAFRTDQVTRYRDPVDTSSSSTSKTLVCGPWNEDHNKVPRFDAVWWLLSANPYVVLADAVPASFTKDGAPKDLFGGLASGARQAQIAPKPLMVYDGCSNKDVSGPTPAQVMSRTVPSWFVGLGLHLLLAPRSCSAHGPH